jgi:hypothetical protein
MEYNGYEVVSMFDRMILWTDFYLRKPRYAHRLMKW